MRPRRRREKRESHDVAKKGKRKKRKEEKEEGRKLRPIVQSRLALIWLATETVGGVSPALFFSFILFFFPDGYDFFLVFRMIKSKKG
jgi:hypothetical protein